MSRTDEIFTQARGAEPEPNSGERKIPVGGVWEQSEWEIHYDYRLSIYDESRCAHAVTHPDGHKTLPRVVVGSNEGGFSSTGICMDCIIENA